jgi:cytochrome c oxidase cbb3-type subunit I/II
MKDPRSTSPGSIMPQYTWLFDNTLNTSLTADKLHVMRRLNVPYTERDEQTAVLQLQAQAKEIAGRLAAEGYTNTEDKEIVAVIAYLQRLGKQPTSNPFAVNLP